MFRSKPHAGLFSAGIYYLLSPFPPAWSTGEVGSAQRRGGKGQEAGRAVTCAPGPADSSSNIYLPAQKPGSSGTDGRGPQPAKA